MAQVGYLIRQQGQVQYGNQNWTTNIQGVSAELSADHQLADRRGPRHHRGRREQGRAGRRDRPDRLSPAVRPGENPIGALIQVKSVPLRVIGVLAAKGQSPFGTDQDDLVMIPFTTAERKVLGVAAPSQQQTPLNWPYLPPPNPYNLQPRLTGYVNQIYVQAASRTAVQTAIDQVTADAQRCATASSPATPTISQVRNLSQIVETAES